MPKNVTIYDVAAAAEVSACSVSWVLNDHPRSKGMKMETRTRILEAAERLGYKRNLLASATRTGRINTIAVIAAYENIHYVTSVNQIISGIINEASLRGYSVKIFADRELEKAFRQIGENCIGKVISLSTPHKIREKTALLAEKYSLDLVFAFERGHRGFPAVNVDNVAMVSKMVHFLKDKGHEKIGYLGVTHPFCYVSDRLTGYCRGMEECNLPAEPKWICTNNDTIEGVEKFLSLPEKLRPTAFVAASDAIAATAQKYAWQKGLRIPEDFSVIGIGNTDVARYTLAPLTTVDEFHPGYGSMLIKLILHENTETAPDEYLVFHTRTEIIERESVFNLYQKR